MPRTARSSAWVGLSLALLTVAACGSPGSPTGFSLERASKHVRMMGTAFGSRPATTLANSQARAYIADQLRRAGFQVRLQDAMAASPSRMLTPVVNIIAVRPGQQKDAIALVSHYDSPPESRGAADAGLG